MRPTTTMVDVVGMTTIPPRATSTLVVVLFNSEVSRRVEREKSSCGMVVQSDFMG